MAAAPQEDVANAITQLGEELKVEWTKMTKALDEKHSQYDRSAEEFASLRKECETTYNVQVTKLDVVANEAARCVAELHGRLGSVEQAIHENLARTGREDKGRGGL